MIQKQFSVLTQFISLQYAIHLRQHSVLMSYRLIYENMDTIYVQPEVRLNKEAIFTDTWF